VLRLISSGHFRSRRIAKLLEAMSALTSLAVILQFAREEINATALVGDLSLKISDDGQCELIASIQVNLNIVAEILGHQKPADMAGGYSLVWRGASP
jgi:hypothetical protein